jgi:pseudouridine 5'-phosphatase
LYRLADSCVRTMAPRIKAALFDMDGLLIDSEDWYSAVTNEVLAKYNRPKLPWNIKAQMQGRPGPQSAVIFHQWAGLPITSDEFQEMQKPLQAKYFPRSKPLPGAMKLLEDLGRTSPKVHVALATSSHLRNYELKTKHLPDLVAHFPDENRVLGDDKRIAPGRGKPAPDIYLLALKTINDRLSREGEAEILPEECLVFEDSVPGVEAGE